MVIWIVNFPLSLIVVVVETPIVCLAIHCLGFGLIGGRSYELPGFNFPFAFLGFVLAFLAFTFLGFSIVLLDSSLLLER